MRPTPRRLGRVAGISNPPQRFKRYIRHADGVFIIMFLRCSLLYTLHIISSSGLTKYQGKQDCTRLQRDIEERQGHARIRALPTGPLRSRNDE